MSGLLQRTHQALRIGRVHEALRQAPSEDIPCIGYDMAALRQTVEALMARDHDELSPEAREVLSIVAPLTFRCRTLRSVM